MVGININCKNQNFIDEILCGIKQVETRTAKKNGTGSLDPYIGKRIGLIETGKGKARLRGYATITGRFRYNTEEEFDNHYHLHRVLPYTEYAFNGITKFGYILENVECCDERIVKTRGVVSRAI